MEQRQWNKKYVQKNNRRLSFIINNIYPVHKSPVNNNYPVNEIVESPVGQEGHCILVAIFHNIKTLESVTKKVIALVMLV